MYFETCYPDGIYAWAPCLADLFEDGIRPEPHCFIRLQHMHNLDSVLFPFTTLSGFSICVSRSLTFPSRPFSFTSAAHWTSTLVVRLSIVVPETRVHLICFIFCPRAPIAPPPLSTYPQLEPPGPIVWQRLSDTLSSALLLQFSTSLQEMKLDNCGLVYTCSHAQARRLSCWSTSAKRQATQRDRVNLPPTVDGCQPARRSNAVNLASAHALFRLWILLHFPTLSAHPKACITFSCVYRDDQGDRVGRQLPAGLGSHSAQGCHSLRWLSDGRVPVAFRPPVDWTERQTSCLAELRCHETAA
ncbi:unnamed protein product [Protopolystoma xenopodis]|uniref:Uncharacterized protein n=1 Tax=Protopolystoma xenopodis TaxID=117903 RepID=A0A3S5BV68_9PLAT|nr:unnamed protein product [Protopolystoma xenopodis]